MKFLSRAQWVNSIILHKHLDVVWYVVIISQTLLLNASLLSLKAPSLIHNLIYFSF